MKNKKYVLVVVALIVVIVIYLMLLNNKSYYDGKYPKKIENAVYYTDERAQEMFIDERYYSMVNLKGHELYIHEDILNIDFYFDKDVTEHQIDKARSFALTTFILRHSSPYGESPYGELNTSNRNDIKWNYVLCRIYVNDKLKTEEKYDAKGILID